MASARSISSCILKFLTNFASERKRLEKAKLKADRKEEKAQPAEASSSSQKEEDDLDPSKYFENRSKVLSCNLFSAVSDELVRPLQL